MISYLSNVMKRIIWQELLITSASSPGNQIEIESEIKSKTEMDGEIFTHQVLEEGFLIRMRRLGTNSSFLFFSSLDRRSKKPKRTSIVTHQFFLLQSDAKNRFKNNFYFHRSRKNPMFFSGDFKQEPAFRETATPLS